MRRGALWGKTWQATYGRVSLPALQNRNARLLARELVKKGHAGNLENVTAAAPIESHQIDDLAPRVGLVVQNFTTVRRPSTVASLSALPAKGPVGKPRLRDGRYTEGSAAASLLQRISYW